MLEIHTLGIEDLNMYRTVKNRHPSRSISDMGFKALRRQLAYEAMRRAGPVVVADRWHPSSRLCSDCGAKNEALTLKDRMDQAPAAPPTTRM